MSVSGTLTTGVAAALLAVAPAHAQSDAAAELPFEDSVSLVLASLEALTAANMLGEDQVVFLREGALRLHDEFFSALRSRRPNVRPFPVETGIHRCPDGEPARFPGRRCPTVDNGFAVLVHDLHVPSDSIIELEVGLTTNSAGRGYAASFVRRNGAFVALRFDLVEIT